MLNESLLLNEQMRKVYGGMIPFGLAGFVLGAGSKAFSSMRDGSLAHGKTDDSLKLLKDKNTYLDSVHNQQVSLPTERRKKKEIIKDYTLGDDVKSLVKSILNADTRKKASAPVNKKAVDLVNWDNVFNVGNFIFRGSGNPDGTERLSDIPAAAMFIPAAGAIGAVAGSKLMGMRLENKAKHKLYEEQLKARKAFEDALVYEQETAKKLSKKASACPELIEAVDDFLSATERYDSMTKLAGKPPGLEGPVITLAGILTMLAGYHGLTSGYNRRKKEIQAEEKEKLLGANNSYDNVMKNLEVQSINDQGIRVTR